MQANAESPPQHIKMQPVSKMNPILNRFVIANSRVLSILPSFDADGSLRP